MQYVSALAGRVGRDVTLRHTPGDTKVCTVSVAEQRSIKKDGEWDTLTVWHQFTAWGNLAERASKILTKGALALIHFRIDYSKESVKRKDAYVEINVPELTITAFTKLHGKSGSDPPHF